MAASTHAAPPILTVGTMYPEEAERQLNDPNSNFYKNTHLAPSDPLVEKLRAMLTGGERDGAEIQHRHKLSELNLTADELRILGKGAYNLYLKIGTVDKTDNPLELDATEFILWQGATPDAQKNANPSVTADQWAQDHSVALKSLATSHQAGDQQIFIENPKGSIRTIAGDKFSSPIVMPYGYIRIMDEDPTSPTYKTAPILSGKNGELDLFAPTSVVAKIDAGEPYTGSVTIRSYERGALPDPKVFFTTDVRAALIAEAYNYTGEKKDYLEVGGMTFDPPISLPIDYYNKDIVNTNAYVFTMTAGQLQAWEYALSEHKELRDVRPEQWINDTFGSMERFDAALAKFPNGTPLSRDAYHDVLDQEKKGRIAQTSIATKASATTPAVGVFVPRQLTLEGADAKVAAWQEAINGYQAKHGGPAIVVDGAWGAATESLYEALGKNPKAVLATLAKEGITLHPEHFEVSAPNVPAKPRSPVQV